MLELDEYGVTVAQFRILVIVYLEGDIGLTAIAEKLGVDRSTASRTCDKLCDAGFLARRERKDDRRNLIYSLTPQGRAVVGRVQRKRRQDVRRIMLNMTEEAQDRLAVCLREFSDAAGEPEDPTMVWGLWR